ncbi:MAG: hypothetical protein JST00_20080 [Deltaproteobacteria bacterium]|nr:hypothetical protein [Deltaproteobacteria bacterium]
MRAAVRGVSVQLGRSLPLNASSAVVVPEHTAPRAPHLPDDFAAEVNRALVADLAADVGPTLADLRAILRAAATVSPAWNDEHDPTPIDIAMTHRGLCEEIDREDLLKMLAAAKGRALPNALVLRLDVGARDLYRRWREAGRPDPAKLRDIDPTEREPEVTPQAPRTLRRLTPEQERDVLKRLDEAFVPTTFLEKRTRPCISCKKRHCRCEWRASVWLEIVEPTGERKPVAVDDITTRVRRAIERVQVRERRRKENSRS